VAIVLRHVGRSQFVDGAIWKITRVVYNDIDLADLEAFEGYGPPILLRHIKLKGMCFGADLAYGFMREREVRRDHLRPALRQRQGYRLTNTLAGARHQGRASFVCSY
jgi:hypothetical protein